LIYCGDYHTHTNYSHGKGTVEANVKRAAELGLKEIAITDHGYRHTAFHVRRTDYKYMRRDALAAAQKYPAVKIYLGLETNLQGSDGLIDVNEGDLEDLEILLCGFHKMVQSPSVKEFFSFYVPNFFPTTDRTKLRNTKAYVNAIEKNPIDIITHLKYSIDVDVTEVAKAAHEFGTFIELNGKCVHMSDGEVAKILESGAGLIVNSDAHSPEKVGSFSVPQTVIDRLGIPPERIVNFNGTPDFRLKKWKENKNF